MAATLTFDDQFFRASLSANNNAVLPGPGSTGNYSYYPDPTGAVNTTTSGFGVGIGASGTPNHTYQGQWSSPNPSPNANNGSWLLLPSSGQPGAGQAIVLWCPTNPTMVVANFGLLLRATPGTTPTAYICQFSFGFNNNNGRLINRLGFTGNNTTASVLGNSAMVNGWGTNTSALTTASAAINVGDTVISVAATTNFAVGQNIWIEDGNNSEMAQISVVTAGVSLTVNKTAVGTTTSTTIQRSHASGVKIRSTLEAENIVIAMAFGSSIRLIVRSGLDPTGATGLYNASTNWNGLTWYDSGSSGIADGNASPLTTGSVGLWSGTSNALYFNRVQAYSIGALTDVPSLTSSTLLPPVVPSFAAAGTQVSFSGLSGYKGAAWQTGGSYPTSSYSISNTRSTQVSGGYGAYTNTGTAAAPVDATVSPASQYYYKQTLTDVSGSSVSVLMPARTPPGATVFPTGEVGDSIVDNKPKTAVDPSGTGIASNPQYPHFEKFLLERTQDGRPADTLAIGFSGSKCEDWVGTNGTGTITATTGGTTTSGTVTPASLLSGVSLNNDYLLIEDEIVQITGTANSSTGAVTFAAPSRSHAAGVKCAILKWSEQFPQSILTAAGGTSRGEKFTNLGVNPTVTRLDAFFSSYASYTGPKYVGVCFGANEANYRWYTQAKYSQAVNAMALILASLGYTPVLHYPTFISPYGTTENPNPIPTSEGATGQGWPNAGNESRLAFLALCSQSIDSIVGTVITTTQYGSITVLAGHKAGMKLFARRKSGLYEGLHPGWTGAIRLGCLKVATPYTKAYPQPIIYIAA